jgi:hypothetical protein
MSLIDTVATHAVWATIEDVGVDGVKGSLTPVPVLRRRLA